jgi:hypothetical protein
VNLAWLQLPTLTPLENLSLVEAGRYIAENLNLTWGEALGSTVTGSGGVYATNYNRVPTSVVGALSTGPAEYTCTRLPTTTLSPSGFLLQNCTAEIAVLHPETNETEAWYPRIQDGLIQRRYVLVEEDQSWLRQVFSVGDELVLLFTVPETLRTPTLAVSGTLYRDERVVEQRGIQCEVLDQHTLQCPDRDLVELRSLTVNGQEILPASGQLQILQADATTWVQPPVGPCTAWDPQRGLLTLQRSLAPEDRVEATYRYREYLHVYQGYQDDAGTWHDLDLNPGPGHTYDGGRPTSELLHKTIFLYLLPTAAYRLREADGTVAQRRDYYSGLRWVEDFLRWEAVDSEQVLSDNSQPPSGTTYDPCLARFTYGSAHFGSARFVSGSRQGGVPPVPTSGYLALAAYPCAAILAKFFVTPTAHVAEIPRLDTRVRGGGVPTSVDPHAPYLPGETRRQLETYWDLGGWDGQPVPLAGVLLVELPGDLLTGANGLPQYTHSEIQRLVESHVAAGIRVLLRYT